jgi:hypothetical protein
MQESGADSIEKITLVDEDMAWKFVVYDGLWALQHSV